MPITYEIDPERRLVTSHLSGSILESEVFEHNTQLRADPHFDPTYRQLVDLTGITEVRVSTGMINQTARDQYFTPGTRRAFVANNDGVFGLARMFALRAEASGQTIEVFRDEKPAREWLGI